MARELVVGIATLNGAKDRGSHVSHYLNAKGTGHWNCRSAMSHCMGQCAVQLLRCLPHCKGPRAVALM